MTKPRWIKLGIGDAEEYGTFVGGTELYVRLIEGRWVVECPPVTPAWPPRYLEATSAREAQEEALDIVWRWARGLVAAVEEMQGAVGSTQESEAKK